LTTSASARTWSLRCTPTPRSTACGGGARRGSCASGPTYARRTWRSCAAGLVDELLIGLELLEPPTLAGSARRPPVPAGPLLALGGERLVEQRYHPDHVHQFGQADVTGVDLRLDGAELVVIEGVHRVAAKVEPVVAARSPNRVAHRHAPRLTSSPVAPHPRARYNPWRPLIRTAPLSGSTSGKGRGRRRRSWSRFGYGGASDGYTSVWTSLTGPPQSSRRG
jgi:hypothetical protein